MLWQENCPCDKIWLPVCSQWPVNDWPEDNLENSFGARFFTGEFVNGIPLGVSLRPVLAELERTFRMEKRICSNSRTESFFPFLLFDPADNGRPAPGTERRFEIPPSIVLKTTTTTTILSSLLAVPAILAVPAATPPSRSTTTTRVDEHDDDVAGNCVSAVDNGGCKRTSSAASSLVN